MSSQNFWLGIDGEENMQARQTQLARGNHARVVFPRSSLFSRAFPRFVWTMTSDVSYCDVFHNERICKYLT